YLKKNMICSVYEVIAITIFISTIIGLFLYLISYFFIYKEYNYEKISVYECGFDPFSDIFIPFEVHYYLISILFIIFDIEISFMFPWSISFFYIGFYG